MSNDVNRRDFMKTAGTVAAGVAVATSWNPRSYAQDEKVRVGCIGTGGQGTFHIRDGLSGTPDILIVACADVFKLHRDPAATYAQISNGGVYLAAGQHPRELPADQQAKARAGHKPNLYYDYKEMIANEELDAVIIATPLHTHYDITMYCLDQGLPCFTEKTMTFTIEEARDIVKKCHEKGLFVQIGHQRRYNPKYNLAMNMVYNQWQMGRITHITTQWHRNTNWRRPPLKGYDLNAEEKKYIDDLERHWNWRMYEASSGGLFTELLTHQSDIANWFLKGVPKRVHAWGGIDYWRDGREVDDNIQVGYEYEVVPGDPGFVQAEQRSELQSLRNLNARPYTVRYEYSSILMNAKRGASELIHGEYGTLELTEMDCHYYGEYGALAARDARRKAEEEAAKAISGDAPKDEDLSAEEAAASVTSGASLGMSNKALQKGVPLLADRMLETADVYQFRAFADHVKNGGVPRTNQMVGLTTAITGLAAMEARKTGKAVDIDPAWYTFDFETPSFTEFDWSNEEGWMDARYPKDPNYVEPDASADTEAEEKEETETT